MHTPYMHESSVLVHDVWSLYPMPCGQPWQSIDVGLVAGCAGARGDSTAFGETLVAQVMATTSANELVLCNPVEGVPFHVRWLEKHHAGLHAAMQDDGVREWLVDCSTRHHAAQVGGVSWAA